MSSKLLKSIHEFKNYKLFVIHWVECGERGGYSRIAEAIGVHTSSLSQMIHGDKNLNPDHIVSLGELMGLSYLGRDYFMALLMIERSGNELSRDYWKRKIDDLKERSLSLSERVVPQGKLTEEQRAIFYSSWLYAAVHMLVGMDENNYPNSIAEKLKITTERTRQILEFLVSCGLLDYANGKYILGKSSTYLPHTSPLIARHHQNWRIKSLEHVENIHPTEELFSSTPMGISKETAGKIRELLMQLSSNIYKLALDSQLSEVMCCLNIDWFKVLD